MLLKFILHHNIARYKENIIENNNQKDGPFPIPKSSVAVISA